MGIMPYASIIVEKFSNMPEIKKIIFKFEHDKLKQHAYQRKRGTQIAKQREKGSNVKRQETLRQEYNVDT